MFITEGKKDIIRPIDKADAYIMQRFCLEPRYSMRPSRKWLVAYDKLKKEFLKCKDSSGKETREYVKFYDSDEFMEYMRKRFTGPASVPGKD